MPDAKYLTTPHAPTWCPGCGNFAIWSAVKSAAVKKGWDSTNTALVAGIGCHGHMVNFVRITSFEGLHGRAIPVATGIKLANHKLNVFVVTGDGDSLGEGGNHFIHACRRNHDLTILLHDNAVYGLTTGQTSPASPHGFKTKSTPRGNPDEPFFPLSLAIASGATFAARAYAPDIPGLTDLIIQANDHKGLSVIDILQPCVSFNKEYSHEFYQANTYKLGPEHDITDKHTAIVKASEWGPKNIPLGIFYLSDKSSYEEQIVQIKSEPLVSQKIDRKDFSSVLKKFS